VDGKHIDAEVCVVAMGPWSGQAQAWFNDKLPITYGQKCHSLTFKPKHPERVSNTAVFVDFDGRSLEPTSNIHPTYEFYPRTHQTDPEVYLHGMDEKWRVPTEEDPDLVVPSAGAMKRLKKVRDYVCSGFSNATTLAESACYMPVMLDGEPLIDAVPDAKGAFIATATAEWGITLGPVIGREMARVITGQAPLISLDRFRCARIPRGCTLEQQLAMQQYMRVMQAQKKPASSGLADHS